MKANPDKFQFMILSFSSLAPVELVLDNSTCIISQDFVKVLGITIDKQLNFNEHISLCCTKAARQLNAFARISKYLNLNSRRSIHHSFIASNFSYCPLVWHFCGKTNNAKLEKIQERSLRILCKDYTSSYEELLRNTGLSTLLLNRLKCLLLETFKTIRHINAFMLYSKHTWSHMNSGPKTWFNLNVNLPRTDWDRSHIWELDYGIILWRIIPSFVKSIT